MATKQQFINEMLNIFINHGVYIGTANGELTLELKLAEIIKKETDYGYAEKTTLKNIRRDLEFIGKNIEAGYNMSLSRAGDCSGQIVGALRRLNVIKPTADYSAKNFQTLCAVVDLKSLQPGDLVFDKKKDAEGKGTATHVGVYVGNGMVVESKGREYGVVKRKTSAGPWVIGGRFPETWFDKDVIPPLTRNLKYVEDDLMRGEDVKQCQEKLSSKGYLKMSEVDGIFGKKTDKAVRKFQEVAGLTVDGIVGQNTWKALWA